MTVSIGEFVGTVIGGGLGVAIINCFNDRWKLRQSRKAQLEDREEEKADKTDEISEDVEKLKKEEDAKNQRFESELEDLRGMIQTLMDSQKLLYLDKIRSLGQRYIEEEEITFDDRRMFHMMHDMYHERLHGNGDANSIVRTVDGLPLRLPRKGEVGLDVHHNKAEHSIPCHTRCCDGDSDLYSQEE